MDRRWVVRTDAELYGQTLQAGSYGRNAELYRKMLGCMVRCWVIWTDAGSYGQTLGCTDRCLVVWTDTGTLVCMVRPCVVWIDYGLYGQMHQGLSQSIRSETNVCFVSLSAYAWSLPTVI